MFLGNVDKSILPFSVVTLYFLLAFTSLKRMFTFPLNAFPFSSTTDSILLSSASFACANDIAGAITDSIILNTSNNAINCFANFFVIVFSIIPPFRLNLF